MLATPLYNINYVINDRLLTNDGFPGVDPAKWKNDKNACNGLTMFWIANIENTINDNASVGGFVGLWSFVHSGNEAY